MDFIRLASETASFSGKEIPDVCKAAAMNILEKMVAERKGKNNNKSWLVDLREIQ